MTEQDTTANLDWVPRLDYWGRRVIAVVLLLALVFTMVNVQQFAASNDQGSWWWWCIAWLLDPMATITAATAIVFEVVLAQHGKPRVGWLGATKWYALGCTWAMNIWSSVVGSNPAGILLHSVAPGLVFLLAEAAPRVWTHVAEISATAKTAESLREQPTPNPRPVPTSPHPAPGSSPLVSPLSAAFPVVTRPAPAVTAPAPQPTQTVAPPAVRQKAPAPGGAVTDELVAQARKFKTQRADAGQQCGWRVLQEHYELTQGVAKALARRINNPTRLERVS
jgi:hypothetical protein